MVFVEYERCRIRYLEFQERFAEILLEKERLFTKTQPNAIRYDKETVQTSIDGNPLESYVIALDAEHIDEQLKVLRQNLTDWKFLLECKETELRASREIIDRVYVMRFLEGFGITRICRNINYSRAQVYRVLDRIKKLRQNETKSMV